MHPTPDLVPSSKWFFFAQKQDHLSHTKQNRRSHNVNLDDRRVFRHVIHI
jgi:hypothetical protein